MTRATTATAIRFSPELHQRLKAASEDHDRPINWLVERACEMFLDRLLPASEIVLVREPAPPAAADQADTDG